MQFRVIGKTTKLSKDEISVRNGFDAQVREKLKEPARAKVEIIKQ